MLAGAVVVLVLEVVTGLVLDVVDVVAGLVLVVRVVAAAYHINRCQRFSQGDI